MTLEEYQKTAFTLAKYPDCGTGSVAALSYCGLGLGEAGEVQGKLKKILRGDNEGIADPSVKMAIVEELGDVLWYVSSLSTELGVSLDRLAEINLEKLTDRKKRNVIKGSGDNR